MNIVAGYMDIYDIPFAASPGTSKPQTNPPTLSRRIDRCGPSAAPFLKVSRRPAALRAASIPKDRERLNVSDVRQRFYPGGDFPLEPPSVVKVQRQNSTSVRICQAMSKQRVIEFDTKGLDILLFLALAKGKTFTGVGGYWFCVIA